MRIKVLNDFPTSIEGAWLKHLIECIHGNKEEKGSVRVGMLAEHKQRKHCIFTASGADNLPTCSSGTQTERVRGRWWSKWDKESKDSALSIERCLPVVANNRRRAFASEYTQERRLQSAQCLRLQCRGETRHSPSGAVEMHRRPSSAQWPSQVKAAPERERERPLPKRRQCKWSALDALMCVHFYFTDKR